MWVPTTITRYFQPVHPQKSPQRFREDGNANQQHAVSRCTIEPGVDSLTVRGF